MWDFGKQEVYIWFVYFKKVYDPIHRPSLFNTPKEFNFPKKLINLIKASIEKSEIKIKRASPISQSFRVDTDLRQRDALSPISFNLVLKNIVCWHMQTILPT